MNKPFHCPNDCPLLCGSDHCDGVATAEEHAITQAAFDNGTYQSTWKAHRDSIVRREVRKTAWHIAVCVAIVVGVIVFLCLKARK